MKGFLSSFLAGFLFLLPFYLLQVVSVPDFLQGGSGDLLLIPWVLLIVLGVVAIGYFGDLGFRVLLVGCICGLLFSYVVFAFVVGWSYVMFFMIPISAFPILVGVGVSCWLKNH